MHNEELIEIEQHKERWYRKYDAIVNFLKSNGGTATIEDNIYEEVRIGKKDFKTLLLVSISLSNTWIVNDILLSFADENEAPVRIVVSRSFEAKAFGDIKDVEGLFSLVISLLKISNNKIQKTMAKENFLKSGTPVAAKKFNGESFLGVYVHTYNDGSHCVSDGNKKWCCHPRDVREADEEGKKIVYETIIKPQRDAEKRQKENNDDELTIEDMEGELVDAELIGEETIDNDALL